MLDLTKHLTTRADDSHAAPVTVLPKALLQLRNIHRMSNPGKVLRVVELNHMLHRLCGPPSIPLSFSLATVLPRRYTYVLTWAHQILISGTPSVQRLLRGLPGYLIPFATHAFAPQRQYLSRKLPSPSVFLLISTNFTSTPGIPLSSPVLKSCCFKCTSRVEPRAFTPDRQDRLRALYAQ